MKVRETISSFTLLSHLVREGNGIAFLPSNSDRSSRSMRPNHRIMNFTIPRAAIRTKASASWRYYGNYTAASLGEIVMTTSKKTIFRYISSINGNYEKIAGLIWELTPEKEDLTGSDSKKWIKKPISVPASIRLCHFEKRDSYNNERQYSSFWKLFLVEFNV